MKNFLLFAFLLAVASVFSVRGSAQVIVIANPSVKSGEVTKDTLRDVFSGNASSLKDGSRVVPVLLKDGPTHQAFLAEFVGKSDSAFKAGWRSLVFSGQGSMPKSVESDAAMVEFVAHNPGAVGYIDKSSPHDGAKTLRVY
ncbi:hypothetical protein DYQ86_02335 [Acidobacteria bacterium AB60]|nr:hypothetical protein DYQ86_02335 [Acidobacteria bacterium AB60]